MSQNHQRYEAVQREVVELLQQYQSAKEQGVGAALRVFSRLRQTLEHLIFREENELFPSFEQVSDPSGEGPTEIMRVEHRQIRALLNDIEEKLRQGNMKTDAEQVVLHGMLTTHQRQERQTLQQAIERFRFPASPPL